MKLLVLRLVNGTSATFFLSDARNLVVVPDGEKNCTLIDGLNNNGGWRIAESAPSVTLKIKNLFGI